MPHMQENRSKIQRLQMKLENILTDEFYTIEELVEILGLKEKPIRHLTSTYTEERKGKTHI